MPETAHTPGPWRVVIFGHEAFILNEGERAPMGITSIPLIANGMNYSENLANANLIAAAPDLLEALQAFMRAPSVGSRGPGSLTIEVQAFNLNAARAAIAKAEGE